MTLLTPTLLKKLSALLRDTAVAVGLSLALLLVLEVVVRMLWPQVLTGRSL
ncbi:MAG: hypothetical protein H0T50_06840, partial [Gemmatimonadales bacterium]|nr:hypothetical protein [Gemmatimonadales bacterium]